MQLKSLTISLNPQYYDNAGRYSGACEFTSPKGTMNVTLDPDFSEKVLIALAPVLEEFSKRSAETMSQSILASVEAVRQIPVSV